MSTKIKKKIKKIKVKKEEELMKARFSDFSIDELINLSFTIITKDKKTKEDRDTLKVLKYVTDDKIGLQKIKTKNFNPYPDYNDEEFNKKIFEKKEFNINKISSLDKSKELEDLVDSMCRFNLSENQKFLKTYISENTPYNGILLFHGTGVGKTCSSISIAENFKELILKTNKKINILLNPSIKASFIKNIFNLEKLKELKNVIKKGVYEDVENVKLEDLYADISGCTKTTYLDEANVNIEKLVEDPKRYIDTLTKKINKLIKNRYQFYGYGEFSNKIEKIKREISERFNDQEQIDRVFRNSIDSMFSNSVMIIDEVHNTKETSDTKVLPKVLRDVFHIVKNMKLILLSATPMFDKPQEIIQLINFLLINDKREPIQVNQVFNRRGDLTEEGKIILLNKSRGYISYLRGEHPIKFPKRLYPDIFNHEKYKTYRQPILTESPSVDLANNKIPKIDRIKILKLIGCKMRDHQLDRYSSINLEDSEDDMGAFNKNGLMASNIVYPSDEDRNITQLIGDNGFNRLLKKESKNKYSFKEPEYASYFTKKELGRYSCKLSQIINNIETSEGIIFIYSQFIKSGILPLAVALELNGYSKFGGSLLKDEPDKDKKYLIISGDNDISRDAYAKYLKIESKNKNGELVKIIIGSETAAEGLDFKYIREVHVLEPWHHFNKIEQVIGRGIRNCSHKDLPSDKRNVMVYLYSSVLPDKKIETIDLKMYRISEKKMRQIAEVEYLLKTSAVDCNLNLEGNRFISDFYKKKYKQTTSKGTEHLLSLNDENNSKMCNFKECDFKCLPNLETPDKLNTSTFSFNNVKDNIYDIKKFVKKLFNNTPNTILSLKKIEEIYNFKYQKNTLDLLHYSLEEILNKDEVFSSYMGTLGTLKKKDSNYIFTPLYLKNQFTSYQDLVSFPTKKRVKLNITNYKIKQSKKKKKKVSSLDEYLLQSVKVKDTLQNKILKNRDLYIDRLSDSNFGELKINYLTNIFNELTRDRVFLYDYINPKLKEILFKSLLILKYKYSDKKFMIDGIINDLKTNFIYENELSLDESQSKDIWGYKVYDVEKNNIKYIQFNRQTHIFEIPSVLDIQKIQKNVNKKIRSEKINNTIGYLEYKKSTNEVLLKIRDKTNEGKKGTQIKTGSVCGNDGMKKDKIIEFISNVLNSVSGEDEDLNYMELNKTKLPGKPNLCIELELYLRNYDLKNMNGKRWFFNLEEAIEREINKKIY